MINIKIPIENTTEVIIGDIWVNVDIEFKSAMHYGARESIVINGFNARMDVIASELKREIQNKLRELLDSGEGK